MSEYDAEEYINSWTASLEMALDEDSAAPSTRLKTPVSTPHSHSESATSNTRGSTKPKTNASLLRQSLSIRMSGVSEVACMHMGEDAFSTPVAAAQVYCPA